MAVCVHAHCYQPPREDSRTGEVPLEPTAAPQHDWNQRITEQCYRPLAAARILDAGGSLARAVNLYGDLSFNVAPTLAVWLDRFAPDVMAAMVVGDQDSCRRHDGHGGAIAHPWVHAILPLTSERDRRTIVRWGIADFVRRFGRQPEGMWLPETAADTASLEALAEAGIAFTILAPHQVVPSHAESSLDPQAPARVRLPSGRSIVVFTYNGSLAHGVAFGDLLDDGARFAESLTLPMLTADGLEALHSLATDAETFGHHHVFGEMALAFAFAKVREAGDEIVPFAAWMHRHGVDQEAALVDDTSWSCAHGIERWRGDCGCRIGAGRGRGQGWRAPLRDAITWLVDRVSEMTDELAHAVFDDPWAARDAYVDLLVGHTDTAGFVAAHTREEASSTTAIQWMEAHRHLLLAQSSCAWFFDDADGHETQMGMHQAVAAIEAFGQLTGVDLRPGWDERTAAMFSLPAPSARA